MKCAVYIDIERIHTHISPLFLCVQILRSLSVLFLCNAASYVAQILWPLMSHNRI